jgi:glycosyltransferase involved in cell wall biosynthesis
MTDPLGQSQVINYLIGLKKFGYGFDILSFEKEDKFKSTGKYISDLLIKNDIGWHPQIFHTKPPIISKIFDRHTLFSKANKLHKKNNYALIHCRSYTASEVGLQLKRKTGVKFLFDMRGFWADEKADGGHWDQNKLFWRSVFKFYKNKEKEFITNADFIIALTQAAKFEIESWPFYNKSTPLVVIPCCADINQFSLITKESKAYARKLLGIADDAFVLSYLGSLGAWYMLAEMLQFFSILKSKYSGAKFLIITNTEHSIILKCLNEHNISIDDVILLTVPFVEVPKYMYASDVSISFIKPVYSKMSSSPVKIGEILSMGIPIIANNIGDASLILNDNNVGSILNDFEKVTMMNVALKLKDISHYEPKNIRAVALKNFSLDDGILKYYEVYKQLFA